MQEIDRARFLFSDAWALYGDAIEELDRGKPCNAAEKAWGATKRATGALILARTGREPCTAGQTHRRIRTLRRGSEAFRQLELRYQHAANVLRGECFYDANCEPEDVLAMDIRGTADYIRDAEGLAGA